MPENTVPEVGALSRRRALKWGSAAAGGLLVAGLVSVTDSGVAQAADVPSGEAPNQLPVRDLEKIIGVQGTVSNGVLNIEVDRDDVSNVKNSFGVPIKPAFQVNGNLVFQSLGDHDRDGDDGKAMAAFNGGLPFLAHELQRRWIRCSNTA